MKFESSFKENTKGLLRPLTLKSEIDILVDDIEKAVYQSAEGSIPKLRVTERSKPWWSPELTAMRKALHTAFRRYKKNPRGSGLEGTYRKARSTYFHAIRKAKREHWNTFLEEADDNDIYTALKFTKSFVRQSSSYSKTGSDSK